MVSVAWDVLLQNMRKSRYQDVKEKMSSHPFHRQIPIFTKLQASLASNWHPLYHDLDLATGMHLGLGKFGCISKPVEPTGASNSVPAECGGTIPFPDPPVIKWRMQKAIGISKSAISLYLHPFVTSMSIYVQLYFNSTVSSTFIQ